MKKYFDKNHNRLVFIGQKASDTFWDKHWANEDFERLIKSVHNRLIIRITKKYLPPGSRILEGGCGRGNNVYLLAKYGYDAYGVDWAQRTVDLINRLAPELKVTCQDVRNLNFDDGFFDGYWSLGVIEHFYEGYERIIKEANRVIKGNGFLFLTFPSLSFLRKFKSKCGLYVDYYENQDSVKGFYQFALDENKVIKTLNRNGFKLIEKGRYDGIKGLKDEVSILKPILQKLYDSSNPLMRVERYILNCLITPLTGI